MAGVGLAGQLEQMMAVAGVGEFWASLPHGCLIAIGPPCRIEVTTAIHFTFGVFHKETEQVPGAWQCRCHTARSLAIKKGNKGRESRSGRLTPRDTPRRIVCGCCVYGQKKNKQHEKQSKTTNWISSKSF